jgi:redox-sensitive bicupin YhaK (pirin superfamily)
MSQRMIKRKHQAVRDDIADLTTYRALPTSSIENIDPFLFLNHHGFQTYPSQNSGLPFGPHPHRGFETVTFILKGDIAHQDTGGHQSVIEAGGVQWMTAGKGLIHSEVSSEKFKKQGGDLEILQLWVNLPARLKMTKPRYIGLQKGAIPKISVDDQKVQLSLISGEFQNQKGAFEPLTDIFLSTLEVQPTGKIQFSVPAQRNIFFYVVSGTLLVNGESVQARQLVDFENRGEDVDLEAQTKSVVLFGHAEPYHEPIVSHGPFVMNTRDEIIQAIHDYQAGQFNGSFETTDAERK